MQRTKVDLFNQTTSESGFALPVAIGIGLIMLLLGVTMIVRSQEDRINVASQTARAKSLAAADVGVSKLRAFINRYRAIALYPSSGADSWENPGAIATLLNIDCGPSNYATDLAQINPSGPDWPDVITGEPEQGEYKLISYVYNGSPGIPGNSGTLTVQGRINANQPGEAVAQVVVEMPVTTRQSKIAGLWVTGTGTPVQGDPSFEGNVMGACGTTLNVDAATTATNSGLAMPAPLPQPPASDLIDLATAPPGALTLPRATDTAIGGIYQYVIPQLNRSITVQGTNPVYIWVAGDLNLEGQTIRRQTCGSPCSPLDLRIFGTNTTGQLTLDDAATLCDVLFHAPDYDVTFTSGAAAATSDCDSDPAVVDSSHNNSAYWVNTWFGDTGTLTIAAPGANWSNYPIQLPPQLDPVQNWETSPVSMN